MLSHSIAASVSSSVLPKADLAARAEIGAAEAPEKTQSSATEIS